MTSGKVISIASRNWKVMLKALFSQIIILALAVSLCMLIFGGFVEEILEAFSSVDFSGFIAELIQSITNKTFDSEKFAHDLSFIISDIRDAVETIPNIWNKVEVSYVICLVLLLLYRMLISFTDVSVGFQVHEFMTSNASRPFTWFLVKKFGESCRFISLQMLLTLPLDLMIFISSGAIFVIAAVQIGFWAAIPAGLVLLVMYSLRHSMFSFWLPSLVSDELGVRKSLTKGVATIPYRFGQVFWKTLVIILSMSLIFVISLLYINNSIVKLIVGTVPNLVLFFLLKCVNLVEYFEATSRPYFSKNVDVEGTERYNKKAQRRSRRIKNG